MIRIFKSFEEQEMHVIKNMARSTPLQQMEFLRKIIDRSYAMHGFDPTKIPMKHTITILSHDRS
jgi:hypothetical protein